MSENVLKMMNSLFEELNSLDIDELNNVIEALKAELQDLIEKIELNEKVLERKFQEIRENDERAISPLVINHPETSSVVYNVPKKMSLREKITWGLLLAVIGSFLILGLISLFQ